MMNYKPSLFLCSRLRRNT